MKNVYRESRKLSDVNKECRKLWQFDFKEEKRERETETGTGTEMETERLVAAWR